MLIVTPPVTLWVSKYFALILLFNLPAANGGFYLFAVNSEFYLFAVNCYLGRCISF